jgi:phytoene dehydrogenase-like protein
MTDQRRYDVIIIGAGVAGLTCGNYLMRMGKKVLILEHGKLFGGNIQGVRRKGFFFDCGCQSTESVGILFPILADLGLYDPAQWDRGSWRWVTPDCDVPLKDYDQIREDFKHYFPESSAGIDKWFDFIVPGCKVMKGMMGEMPFPLVKQGLEKYRIMAKLSKVAMGFLPMMREGLTLTGREKGLRLFDDPRLAFLFGEFGDPNMLLFMYFSFWYSFVNDYWYPKGGLMTLADILADRYQELGGEVMLSTTVERVLTSGSTAIGVETAEGERYFAEKIVNTGNPKRLVGQMIDPSLIPGKYGETIKNGPVSYSMSTAFLGLDIDDGELARNLKCTHTLYWRNYGFQESNYDPDIHRKGMSMLTWCSMHDKSLAPAGQNSIIVQVRTPYHWMNGWGTGSEDPMARTEEYRKLKEKVLDGVIEDTEALIPGLRDKIVHKELATPRSLSKHTLNPEGSIMGWSYDMYRTPLYGRFGRFKTPLDNLYMAGHYSVWPGGVVFSALSGKIVADGMYRGIARTLLW